MLINLVGGDGYIGSRLLGRARDMEHDVVVEGRFGASRRVGEEYASEVPVSVFLAWPRKSVHDRLSSDAEADEMRRLRCRLGATIEQSRFTLFISTLQAGAEAGKYGARKLEFEKWIRDNYSPDRADFVRLGTVYGPSANMRWDLVVNHMYRDLKARGVILLANPTCRRAHAPIGFVVDQIMDCLERADSDDPKPVQHPVLARFSCAMQELPGIFDLMYPHRVEMVEYGVDPVTLSSDVAAPVDYTTEIPEEFKLTPTGFARSICDSLMHLI